MQSQHTSPYQEARAILDGFSTRVAQSQNNDGSFPTALPTGRLTSPSAIWTSAQVGYFVLLLEHEQRELQLESLLNFVLKSQQADGGFGYTLNDPSDPIGTSLCLLFMTGVIQSGGPADDQRILAIKRARDYLLSAMLPQGTMGSEPNKQPPKAFDTCVANIALANCLPIRDAFTPRIIGSLRLTLEFLSASRQRRFIGQPYGWGATFGTPPDALGTIYSTYLLQQLYRIGKIKPDMLLINYGTLLQLTDRSAWLYSAQNTDGTWNVSLPGSSIEMAAGGLITLISSGIAPSDPKVETSVRYLIQHYTSSQGWPPNPGKDAVLWVSCLAYYALSNYVQAVIESGAK